MSQGMSTAVAEREMVEVVAVQPVRECEESPLTLKDTDHWGSGATGPKNNLRNVTSSFKSF